MAGAFDPLPSLSDQEREDLQRSEQNISRRVLGFRVVVVAAFLILGVRLWDMQVVQTQQYVTKAVQNRVRVRTVSALRGVIHDRNGTQLVFNRPSFDVTVDVQDLPLKAQPAVIARLAKLLKADPRKIEAKVNKQRQTAPGLPVTVATSIPWATLLTVKEEHMDLPGVLPVETTIRQYTDGPIFSNIVGYIGPITEREYTRYKKDGYQKDSKAGKAGVELTYEKVLRGKDGLEHVEVDAGGRVVRVLDRAAPTSGDSLGLTIDASLQKDVARYLRWGLDRARCYDANPQARPFTASCPAGVRQKMALPFSQGGHGNEGAAIVMDVHTGEILAMVASPQYDNNVFSGRAVDRAAAAQVLTSAAHPLIDRALAATAPASTYKQITASAALQEHVVTPTSGFSVAACWAGFCNWDPRAYTNMTVTDAIAQSNDIWMASVVLGNGLIRGIGPDKLAWYAQQFGIGHQLGIDLPFEQRGLAPTPEWKAKMFPKDPTWYPNESKYVAIGQSYDLATPLQMADVAATVANGGNVMWPHVTREIVSPSGKVVKQIGPRVERRVPVDEQYLKTVAAGMRKGVTSGSSVLINLHDIQVAGKTGTAEFVENGPNGKP
ncbi:MAG: penicillin-binding protein 2, partial [Chloroflexota bacterium]